MAYCDHSDLLLGSVPYQVDDVALYVQAAAEDIDSVLGFTYSLPLTAEGGGPIPAHVATILRKINRNIATGKFLLARYGSSEEGLHQFGLSLLKEGEADLQAIAAGGLQLMGVTKTGPQGDEDGGNAPRIIHGDASSGVDAFYDWMNTGPLDNLSRTHPYWRPGP